MTSRQPPRGRPPQFDSYRPSEDRNRPTPAGQPHPDFDAARRAPPARGMHPGMPPAAQSGQPPLRDTFNYARPAVPTRQPRRGWGSTVLYGLLGLVAMGAGAVAFAMLTLPADFVRDYAVRAVKEKTGRDLVIAGPASFSIYPAPSISLSNVSLSSAPGAPPLVAMKSLDLSVAMWPLLERQVRIKALVLRDPVFDLEVDQQGRRSWDFAEARPTRFAQADVQSETPTMSDAAPGADEAPPADAARARRLKDVSLEDVRIENGSLHYADKRTGTDSNITAINARLGLQSIAAPLNAEGHLDWKGKTINFSGVMTSLTEVLEARPAKLDLKLGTDVLDATFQGSAKLETLSTEGILSAKSASARDLFAWLGTDLPPSDGFGELTAKGLWRAAPDQYSFSTAEIALDRTTARGDIALDTRGARPLINATLKLTELDLNTYSSKGKSSAKRAAPDARPPAGSDASGDKAHSIEDLIQQSDPPGPRVKGYTKREGWDEQAFDLRLLGVVDADAKLSVAKLKVGNLQLNQSDMTVALKNRVMTTTFEPVRLYEGFGKGTVVVDGTAESKAGFNANLTLVNISAQPLLKDLAEMDRVAGKGRLVVALAGQGESQREIVEDLHGTFEFAFEDGAIMGVNIPEMMRNLSKGSLKGLDAAPTDKTDFSEMTSTWQVKNGIAENQDLKIVSPLLRVAGSGRVELPARELDYVLKPKVVASLAGQGGEQDLSGIEVPVRVHGPWDKPKYSPDLGAVFKNPKTVETIKEIGKQLKGKKADEIVDELLGSGDGSEGGKSKGKKLLDKLFGGGQ